MVHRQRRVLLVEDNPDCRDALVDLLVDAGYTVDPHNDGASALAALLDDQTPRPDVIVTDLIMPRVDGEQFVLAVRSRLGLRAVPIIVLTSTGLGKLPGADMVLRKAEVGALLVSLGMLLVARFPRSA